MPPNENRQVSGASDETLVALVHERLLMLVPHFVARVVAHPLQICDGLEVTLLVTADRFPR